MRWKHACKKMVLKIYKNIDTSICMIDRKKEREREGKREREREREFFQ